MIYLIGGPPKCGKTTLAKTLLQKYRIPWISSDTLEHIGGSVNDKDYQKSLLSKSTKSRDEFYATYSAKKIVAAYTGQAKATYAAIEMMVDCEINDGNYDYTIEGYHITPKLAAKLIKKFGKQKVKAVFIIQKDVEKILENIERSTTPNDWVLRDAKNKRTRRKIAEMIKEYGIQTEEKANKYKLTVILMDNFKQGLKKAKSSLGLSN